MTLPEALATSCDTYFYEVGNRFYEGGRRQCAAAAAVGAEVRLRRARPASTSATRRRRGRRRADARLAQEDVQERLGPSAWNPGDSIQLAIGQKDVTRDAAADGALLRDDRERRQARHAVRRLGRRAAGRRTGSAGRRCGSSRPTRRSDAGVDPRALQAVRDGLYAATHSPNGTSSGVFGNFPISISGKTGTAEKVVNAARLSGRPPRGPVVVVRLRARPTTPRARRLRRDRERRPRLDRRRARRRSRSSSSTSTASAGTRHPGERGLIVDTCHRAARALRSPAVGARRRAIVPPARLAAAARRRARSSRYGLWAIGGITRFDVPGSPTTTSTGRRSPSALGVVGHGRRDPDPDPPSTSATGGSSTAPRSGVDARSSSCSPEAVRGSKRWIDLGAVPVPAVRVRQAALRARDRRLPRRARPPGRRARHGR